MTNDQPTRMSAALHALCATLYAAGRADEAGLALEALSPPLLAFVAELRTQWEAEQADELADAPAWLRALTVGSQD